MQDLRKKVDIIESEKANLTEEIDEKCLDCGKNLVIKHSRNGKFIGCSGFPECKFTRSFISEQAQAKIDAGNKQIEGKKCPKCSGNLRIVSGKYGPFVGCSGYPKCNYMEKINVSSSQNNKKSN